MPTRTTKPIYRRPDIAGVYDEDLRDVYPPGESDQTVNPDRGPMPKPVFKDVSVKATSWNETRPARRGRFVQMTHKLPSHDVCSCEEQGSPMDGGTNDA